MARNGTEARREPVLDILRFGGAGLLAGLGGIHLDLWLTGYRHIPTVGPLFLLQVVASFVLAIAIIASRRWYVAAAGALFAIGTFVSYEVFRLFTIFGFHEVRTTAGFTAGTLEVLAFVALGGYTVLERQHAAAAADGAAGKPAADRTMQHNLGLVAGVGALLAVVLVAIVGVTAVPGHSTKTSASGGKPGVTITIQNFAFHPSIFSVSPGEVVEVVNKDPVQHTLTALPGSSPQGHFNTGLLGTGSSTTFKAPMTAGSYKFNCAVHTFMTGTLIVS